MEINPKNEKIGSYIGIAVAIIIFQIIAPSIFRGPTSEGIDLTQVFFAALAGGIGGVLGKFAVKILGHKPQ